MSDELKSGHEWAEIYGVVIHDPDGWRSDNTSMSDPISIDDFVRRVVRCTISLNSAASLPRV